MRTSTDCIVSLNCLTKDDVASVGGKGANLGELRRAGMPTPPGFVVTAGSYLRVLEENGVRDELAALHDRSFVAGADLAALGAEARRRIDALDLPSWFVHAVVDEYQSFG